jgi:hypothetical protein
MGGVGSMMVGIDGKVTVLLSNVTAPIRASALPFSVAPVVIVID